MITLIIGASKKAKRYSYKAMKLLSSYGHEVTLMHPKIKEIEGQKVYNSLSKIEKKIDTITMYVNSKISSKMTEDILKIHPRRVIFNPGTENNELIETLKTNNILPLVSCTLVMLKSGQY